MERLTKRIVGGVCHYDCSDSCSSCCGCECFDVWKMLDKLAAYEDTGLAPDEIPTGLEMANVFCAMEKLKAYEDAEEQGRLVVLPCKVGSTIYRIENGGEWEFEFTQAIIYPDEISFLDDGDNEFSPNDIGKSIFFTHEAAEAKLKELEGGRQK